MNNFFDYELLAEAVKSPGMKLADNSFPDDFYIYYEPHISAFSNNGGIKCGQDFILGLDLVKFKEPIKMVEWHRPRVIWRLEKPYPILAVYTAFSREKKDISDIYNENENIKVIEWETITAPATWEESK